MEKTIEIKGIEEKEGKDSGKKYNVAKTNEGNLNVWDADILSELKKCYAEGLRADVEIFENEKGFKNIKKFIAARTAAESVDAVKPKEAFADDRYTTMYTSYAKDVFSILTVDGSSRTHKEDMNLAIELVKQAREAFR